jgi:hypothetical protein
MPVELGSAATEKGEQIDDRQQLTAYIRDPLEPGLRAGYPRELLGDRQHLAHVRARCHECFTAEPEGDAGPGIVDHLGALLPGHAGLGPTFEFE